MIRQHKIFVVLAAVSVIAALAPAIAGDLRKIDGEYIVAPRDGQGPIEFGLIIKGVAAKELYAHLPVEEKPDDCTGGMQKSDPKGMYCINDNGKYTCSFGYVLKTHEVNAGPLTC